MGSVPEPTATAWATGPEPANPRRLATLTPGGALSGAMTSAVLLGLVNGVWALVTFGAASLGFVAVLTMVALLVIVFLGIPVALLLELAVSEWDAWRVLLAYAVAGALVGLPLSGAVWPGDWFWSFPLVAGPLVAMAARVTGPYVAGWIGARTAHLGEGV